MLKLLLNKYNSNPLYYLAIWLAENIAFTSMILYMYMHYCFIIPIPYLALWLTEKIA